jgi:DHA1 family tetracycline resistance protein-like MFS transporter
MDLGEDFMIREFMTNENSNTEKLDFKRILPVLVIVLVDLMGLSIIIPLLPLYAARFGSSPLVIGILQATYPMMQFLGAPILGRLSDRFGRKPILIISQIGTLAGFILLGFANSIWLLFLSRIIDGLSGANISTAQAAITDSTNEKTRTQGLGLVGAAFGVGFVMGPIIAFIVLAASGQNYQLVAFTAAFFSLTSILLTIFWFRETLTEGVDPTVARKRPFSFAAIRQALGRPAIGFLLIIMFFYQIAFGGYEQLFSLFTLTRLGMDARDTSGLFVLAGLFHRRARRAYRKMVKAKRRSLAGTVGCLHFGDWIDRNWTYACCTCSLVRQSQSIRQSGGTGRAESCDSNN